VSRLRDNGAKVIGLRGDVANEDDVIALREAALEEFDGVHLVFNNAGVGAGPTIGTPKKVWDWVMAVNVDGVVNGINAFVPHFSSRTRDTSSTLPRWPDWAECPGWVPTARPSSRSSASPVPLSRVDAAGFERRASRRSVPAL
jgi:NAD(P)-dependent dehydrogenase (short-subunit alcohol dehydrogenase family)